MIIWRIIKTQRATQNTAVKGVEIPAAFDGVGASLYPGRWNSKGTSVVYTAGSQSLATLEILVHLEDSALLNSFSIFSIECDERYVLPLDDYLQYSSEPDFILSKSRLKKPPSFQTRTVGDNWVKSNDSLLVAVPSAVIPSETNYLINPYHPDLEKLKIGEPQPFPFDERLSTNFIPEDFDE